MRTLTDRLLWLLTALLTSEGYEVDAAGQGPQALALFRQRRPDLVLLDLLMPGMSGLEVCQHPRQEDLHLPIIVLTAKAEESDKVLGLELGADDYISGGPAAAAGGVACARSRGSWPATDREAR